MTENQRPAWATFASIMMFGTGGFALLMAIADFTNSSWLAGYSILGDTLDFIWYGAFDLLAAIAAFYAGFDIWRGGKVGYWIAIVAATLNVLRWFLFIPGVPFLALTMVVVWILVIYGLSASSEYFD